jgi:hypothetical protein
MSTWASNGGTGAALSDIDGEAERPARTSTAITPAENDDLLIVIAPAW